MIKNTINFFYSICENRKVLKSLISRDFNSQFQGSAFGFFWSFMQPFAFAFIIWFVFTYGFRSGKIDDTPFAVYLLTGMAIWNFFSEALTKSASSLNEYSFLVKKIKFRVSLIPLVKIGSTIISHLIFLFILIIVLLINGYMPNLFWFQALFYLFATIILTIGLGWIFGAINVFFKDTSQILQILLQIGVWASPVFWSYSMFPDNIQKILKYNPIVYIIEGYRNSFLYNIPFWEQENSLLFWGGTLVILLIGSSVFIKLRPHFADVL
jgi:ABC-type polysaccharide/polyol phosphate export permease